MGGYGLLLVVVRIVNLFFLKYATQQNNYEKLNITIDIIDKLSHIKGKLITGILSQLFQKDGKINLKGEEDSATYSSSLLLL